MTGAEFASKYTVLKPLDQRSVRSFVAQEQSTRRAVMVHWLDQLSASDRTAMLSRLDRLPADARERVLGVETVDGAPVVVTRMILDFESFGKWLDRLAPATQPPMTQAPPPAPAGGGFTDIFVASGAPKGAPIAEIESPTISWTPASVPKAPPPPPEPKSEPKPHAPAISVRFREPASGPKPPAPKPPAPPPPKPPAPPSPPKPPAPKPPAAGEFTRIFGATHLEPEPAPPPPPQFMPPPTAPSGGSGGGAVPSATSAMERVLAPPPPPAAPPPPPPLTPSSPWSGPPPVVPLASASASATPMPGANINLPPSAPVMPAQPIQSDFTRIISAAGPTPAGPPPAPAAPAPTPTPPPAAAVGKKIIPMLLAFGTLVLAALGMVIVALIRRR